eukprot:3926291-Alexandrium_andersonii.AAC.1
MSRACAATASTFSGVSGGLRLPETPENAGAAVAQVLEAFCKPRLKRAGSALEACWTRAGS